MVQKLPLACEAEYIPNFLSGNEADILYHELINDYEIAHSILEIKSINYKSDFGKLMFLDEDIKMADKLPESIWGKSVVWSPFLKQLRDRIEQRTKQSFHVAVCIYYPDGSSGIEFHSDDIAYGDTDVIASISLGEERRFEFKEKNTGSIFSLVLAHGSLLIMGENTQQRYYHSLPIDAQYKNPRINITFRHYERKG